MHSFYPFLLNHDIVSVLHRPLFPLIFLRFLFHIPTRKHLMNPNETITSFTHVESCNASLVGLMQPRMCLAGYIDVLFGRFLPFELKGVAYPAQYFVLRLPRVCAGQEPQGGCTSLGHPRRLCVLISGAMLAPPNCQAFVADHSGFIHIDLLVQFPVHLQHCSESVREKDKEGPSCPPARNTAIA